jgi:predicted dehydrogenase
MQKVAVIGAGKMGTTHAKAYAAMPNAELVAICDTRPDAAEELAGTYSARAYTAIEQALKEIEVDAVDICTPTPTHIDYIKIAAAAGKHICCEKPLTRSISQAMEAARICEEAGVTLFPAHVVRWFPEYRRLRDLITSGSIGETVEVRATRGGKARLGVDSWYANMQMSGGVVLDLLVHEFDWLRWCYGNVRRVYGKGLYGSRMPGIDYALVTLRFDNGVIAHVEGNWARPSGFAASVEVAGTQGLLHWRNTQSRPLVIERRLNDGATAEEAPVASLAAIDPYYQELEHFITCLDEGRAPDVTPQDGIEAVRICEAALRSISTGEPVTLA